MYCLHSDQLNCKMLTYDDLRQIVTFWITYGEVPIWKFSLHVTPIVHNQSSTISVISRNVVSAS